MDSFEKQFWDGGWCVERDDIRKNLVILKDNFEVRVVGVKKMGGRILFCFLKKRINEKIAVGQRIINFRRSQKS